MKRIYFMVFIICAVIVSSILWRQTYKSNSVNRYLETLSESEREMYFQMEMYFKQKECTQAMIDQSNGHDRELPEHCPTDN